MLLDALTLDIQVAQQQGCSHADVLGVLRQLMLQVEYHFISQYRAVCIERQTKQEAQK